MKKDIKIAKHLQLSDIKSQYFKAFMKKKDTE